MKIFDILSESLNKPIDIEIDDSTADVILLSCDTSEIQQGEFSLEEWYSSRGFTTIPTDNQAPLMYKELKG